jgi:hypothetical protein
VLQLTCAPSTSGGHADEKAFHLLPDALNGPPADAPKLTAAMENDDARVDEFYAPTENSTDFEIFDNTREAKSIV